MPQLCLLSREHRTLSVYYDIAIAMCITAYVVKLWLLLLYSFVRSFVCLSSIFFFFSFLASFVILPVPMCVVNSSFFPLNTECAPYISLPAEFRGDIRRPKRTYTQTHTHTALYTDTLTIDRVYWFVVIVAVFFGTRAKNFTTDSVVL